MLNVYTYRKLQKHKSLWNCLCCLKKEIPFCSLKNEHLKELTHGKIILSPNKKIITNAIRQSEITDEELVRKANNKFFTPTMLKSLVGCHTMFLFTVFCKIGALERNAYWFHVQLLYIVIFGQSLKLDVRAYYTISELARPLCFPADIYHGWCKLNFKPQHRSGEL